MGTIQVWWQTIILPIGMVEIELTDSDGDGIYCGTKSTLPGDYQYVYAEQETEIMEWLGYIQ